MATKVRARKIIQIQAIRFNGVPDERGQSAQNTELVALCDDGTIWTRTSTLDGEWCPVEGIPDDDLRFEAWQQDLIVFMTTHKLYQKGFVERFTSENLNWLQARFSEGASIEETEVKIKELLGA